MPTMILVLVLSEEKETREIELDGSDAVNVRLVGDFKETGEDDNVDI